MMSTRLLQLSAAALITFALGGCAGGTGDVSSGAAPSGAGPTDVTGTWGSTAQSSPNLTFAAEGTVTGTDGCNRLTGSWSVDGDVVRLGPLASTRMYCEGVDTWLSHASEVVVNGTTLDVSDDTGARIGTLERAQS